MGLFVLIESNFSLPFVDVNLLFNLNAQCLQFFLKHQWTINEVNCYVKCFNHPWLCVVKVTDHFELIDYRGQVISHLNYPPPTHTLTPPPLQRTAI